MRWATGGLNPPPVQHFNAAAGRWRTGRAGLVLNIRLLRVIGGVLAVVGAAALILGFAMF